MTGKIETTLIPGGVVGGLVAENLAKGVVEGSLDLLTEWTVEADQVMVF